MTTSFRDHTMKAIRGDIWLNGESGTIDDAETYVLRLLDCIAAAKAQVSRIDEIIAHAGERIAHDTMRDQRETEH